MVCYLFQFDYLVQHINGEESNKFTNTLGESVVVTVQDSEAATAELLCLLSFYSVIVHCAVFFLILCECCK